MEDRVGKNPPTPEEYQQKLVEAQAISRWLEEHGIVLSDEEREDRTRPRPNIAPSVPLLASIANKYNVTVPDVSIAGMMQDWAVSQGVGPLKAAFTTAQRVARDTEAQALHEMTEGFYALWGVVLVMAKRNPAMANDIRPIQEMLNKGRRRPTEPGEGHSSLPD